MLDYLQAILIPSRVLHDNSIDPGARIIYGEIAYLCGKNNFCWFDYDLFSKLYGASKRTLAKWIKALVDAKYITVEHIPADGKPNDKKMKITLINHNDSYYNN